MRSIRFSLLAILLFAFSISILPGCECNDTGAESDRLPNLRPTIEIVMPPPPYIDENTGELVQIVKDVVYNVRISWRSNDKDGRVLENPSIEAYILSL